MACIRTSRTELEKARTEAMVKVNAQTVFNHIEGLESNRSLLMSRWVWELLQNARDAASADGKLKVEFAFAPDGLTFRHNGTPFSNEEIVHLIYHGSTKRGRTGRLGQFGIGFLSTHLISKQIGIRGQMQNGDLFSFLLNREGDSFTALAENMDKSWEDFNKSLIPGNETVSSEFTTEYCYPLDADVSEFVKAGLLKLRNYAPYLLAFNDVLTSIRIKEHEVNSEIIKEIRQPLDGGIYLIQIQTIDGTGKRGERYVALAVDEQLSVAVLAVKENGGLTVDLDISAPKIFLAFPLSDTHDFCFPAVINCELFKPRENRDGIYLGTGDNEANRSNQLLIQKACNLLLKLLVHATERNWWKAHRMAQLGVLKNKAWLDEDWYKDLVKAELIEPIRSANLFVTLSHERISPKDAWIPIGSGDLSSQRIWGLASELKEGEKKLPLKEDTEDWIQNLISWSGFLDQEPHSLLEGFTLQKLAEHVANLHTIENLAEALAENTDPINWVNEFYLSIHEAGLSYLLDDLGLLPDQKGTLRRASELFRDEGIDERLKNIGENLNINYREKLLHHNVTLENIKEKLHTQKNDDLLAEVLQELKRRADQRPLDDEFRRANVELFTWILRNDHLESLEGFPAITEADSESEHCILQLRVYTSPDDSKPLAPFNCWPEKARAFNTLFPKRMVLGSEYFDNCSDEELWAKLAARGYLRTTLLYTKSERIDTFLPEGTMPESEEGISHRTAEKVKVSKIAFLTADDIGLLPTVRKSKVKAVQLLRFLVQYMVEEDSTGFDVLQVDCECGISHRYYRAGWLIPLKTRQWVPLGGNKSSQPTAGSLARLVEEENDLTKMLSEGVGTKLMEVLDVSIAEFTLQSIAKDEDTKVKLIRSLSDIAEATGNDIDKISMLAEEIKTYPEVLCGIEEHRIRREKVRRNQLIGGQVEQCLKELLEIEGLKVTRTGVGSDFEVENDVIEGDEEILLNVNKGRRTYLVEVKSTRDENVRMTVRQACTAVGEKGRFVLCIVRLSEEEVTKEAVLERSHFVLDIGERIQPVWNEYLLLEATKRDAQVQTGDIKLEMTQSETRFSIGQETWASGVNFEDVAEYFLNNKDDKE